MRAKYVPRHIMYCVCVDVCSSSNEASAYYSVPWSEIRRRFPQPNCTRAQDAPDTPSLIISCKGNIQDFCTSPTRTHNAYQMCSLLEYNYNCFFKDFAKIIERPFLFKFCSFVENWGSAFRNTVIAGMGWFPIIADFAIQKCIFLLMKWKSLFTYY